MDSGQGLSLDPGVLSLLKNPGGDNLIATVTQYFPVATHLPHTLIRNSGDGINGIQAAPLECCQFEIFAATNDVAPIDVATRAMLCKQCRAVVKVGFRGEGASSPSGDHRGNQKESRNQSPHNCPSNRRSVCRSGDLGPLISGHELLW